MSMTDETIIALRGENRMLHRKLEAIRLRLYECRCATEDLKRFLLSHEKDIEMCQDEFGLLANVFKEVLGRRAGN